MQLSKLCLMAFVAGAASLQLQAQPARPELQDQALELLRQTIAEQRADSQAPKAPRPPDVSVGELRPSEPAQVRRTPTPPASPEQQQHALELLRNTLAESQPPRAPTPPVFTPSPAKVPAPPKAADKTIDDRRVPPPTIEATPPTPSALPDQPAVPKTKQQRLAELLERYRADQLTPAEYHAERARILAEP